MCGIWAVFGSSGDIFTHCKAAFKIAHRGPDAFRLESIYQFPSCCLGFHRLAILDAQHGMQPMRVPQYPHVWLIYNGEIYNHANLQQEFNFHYATKCDGESIIHLYAQGGIEFAAKHLDGVFAFCLLDTANRKVYLGRDTFGVKPLFRILKEDGFLSACSEVKALKIIVILGLGDNPTATVEQFLPGHVETYNLDSIGRATFVERTRFHKIGDAPAYKTVVNPTDKNIKSSIRTLFEAAVKKRMMADRRIGCLLSGGLDSSLTAATLVKLAKEQNLPYPVQTFSIGMKDSPDLVAARKVAKHLKTEHHEIVFKPEEGIAAIESVIYHLESYDITTVRSSVGLYLLSKYIKQKTDTTVILSGEGSDEIAQGYIYFHKAPSVEDGNEESSRLCKDLYMYDVLRSDRSTSAWGLEIRVPFLDHQFSSYYISLEPEMKAPKYGIEKYLLRSAFDKTGLLPAEILWRPKEDFSDGVSSQTRSWYEVIQDFVDEQIDDTELEESSHRFPHNPPRSKEALYYRRVFEKFYTGQGHLLPYYWMPKCCVHVMPLDLISLVARDQIVFLILMVYHIHCDDWNYSPEEVVEHTNHH
ncbi:Asparagine synthetase [glutamine-hydrolyzing] [Mizuhopecten yessoensis]|uniref:Asparagine synthetase [glutamine-hydrolyzing] n=1 Tax=Mizuhopecten yessoensis TaxID=6573 RepID=A0A210PVE5_MIZYE|nr:Asparagine synthetase [glutamine-hydrolyzing] [Mizuhopecten yessoensis]